MTARKEATNLIGFVKQFIVKDGIKIDTIVTDFTTNLLFLIFTSKLLIATLR